MGFRFRRSIKILPGVRLNFSGGGTSVSVGPRGLRYTVGSKGTRTTVGLPGTGLSWTDYRRHQSTKPVPDPGSTEPIRAATDTALKIESEPAETINAQSISELAPSLNVAQKRFRLTPTICIISLPISIFALTLENPALFQVSAVFAAFSVITSALLDRYRRSIKISYSIEGTAKIISKALAETFSDVRSCKAVWAITTTQSTSDWKRNAGASTLNDRNNAELKFAKPQCIRGELSLPAIKANSQELYFLPDALLLLTKSSVAALTYQELHLNISHVNFIEEKTVPSDAFVIGTTWQFVNKKGGPDRRFNDNRQLPICRYGQMTFRSASGLNFVVQYSSYQAAERFSEATNILQRPSSRIESKSITSAKVPSAWPGRLFLTGFSIVSVVLLIFVTESSNAAKQQTSTHSISSSTISKNKVVSPRKFDQFSKPQDTSAVTVQPQIKARPAPVANPLQVRFRTLAECLAINDVDARTDCYEEVHSNSLR